MVGKGTSDNIFILQSAIQLKLRQKGGKLFALFIDFKKAFDSVPQSKLWAYPHSVGMSSKFLRILAGFYNQATIQVKAKDGLSEQVDVSEGVLQGEILSPLLFILYLGDIVKFFAERGAVGVSLNAIRDLLLLLYADDLVILANSPVELTRMIMIMEEYCAWKGLTVNISKTKIVVFRKGGPPPTAVQNLSFNGERIEVVESYVYLGVTFSSSGLGYLAAEESHRKARIAMGSVLSILSKASADSWTSTLKLYDSLAASVLAASVRAHLFGLRYIGLFEKAQLYFFKRFFHLSKYTPGYSLRLELGLPKVTVAIVKAGINWIIKILKMDENRLPRICFTRLLQLKASPSASPP